MLEVNFKKARSSLSALLNKVERGEKIMITRHGKKIAILVSPEKQEIKLPSLMNFRAKIKIKGDCLSKTISDLRDEERF